MCARRKYESLDPGSFVRFGDAGLPGFDVGGSPDKKRAHGRKDGRHGHDCRGRARWPSGPNDYPEVEIRSV